MSLMRRLSTLPICAIEGGPPRLHDPPHALGAIAAGTGLPFSAINCPVVLKIAEFAVGLNIITYRRAAGRNGLCQDGFDPCRQPVRPPPADRRGQPSRRQPGAIERLADIDVAEPGDDPLIK